MLWLVILKFALCPAFASGRVIRHPGHDGAVLVNSIFPPTAGDHLEILSVASAALPLDAVENVLPILQMQDRGSFRCRIVLLSFSNSSSMLIMHALYLMPFPMTASVPDSMRITPPPGVQSQTGLECNTPKSGARTSSLD